MIEVKSIMFFLTKMMYELLFALVFTPPLIMKGDDEKEQPAC